MNQPNRLGAGGGGQQIIVGTPQPSNPQDVVAQDFAGLISGLQGEVADMTALAADMNSSMAMLQGIIDYANVAYAAANNGSPNFQWSGFGTSGTDRPGAWLAKIQAFAAQRLPTDVRRAQKAQTDSLSALATTQSGDSTQIALLQQQIDQKNAALSAASDALASAAQQLSACKQSIATINASPPPAPSMIPMLVVGVLSLAAGAGGLYAYNKYGMKKAG